MPAKSISALAERDGPTIQMVKSDHKLTRSYGMGQSAEKYRHTIKGLIENGNWREAMTREIKKIRRIQNLTVNPRKYNEAMLEMLEYFKCLEKNGLLP